MKSCKSCGQSILQRISGKAKGADITDMEPAIPGPIYDKRKKKNYNEMSKRRPIEHREVRILVTKPPKKVVENEINYDGKLFIFESEVLTYELQQIHQTHDSQ